MTVSKKAPERAQLHPVQTLKEHIVSLDAAMLVAVTAAEVGAVHRLRTGTRRVEAFLRLVELLEGGVKPLPFPAHRKEADVVHRRLRRVRRAAGAVRDLDLQAEVIWYDAPAKTAVHKGTPGEAMRKQAKQLRKSLKHRREIEAVKLIDVLKNEQEKLAAALRALESALKPASYPSISGARLGRVVQQWFGDETRALLGTDRQASKEALRSAIENLTEDQLHSVRKTAKLCRYMAESSAEGTPLRGRAKQFENLQEAGGQWHDWLLLARIAGRFHGHKAELTQRYTKHRDAALAEYHLRLAELLPVLMYS